MTKKKYEVVYNACYGGFGISEKAVRQLRTWDPDNPLFRGDDCTLFGERYSDGKTCNYNFNFYGREIPRHHPLLIKVVRELGEESYGQCAKLKIEKLDGTQYRIDEYDGFESIEQPTDTINWNDATEI